MAKAHFNRADPRRRSRNLAPRTRHLIVCGGEVTEGRYFRHVGNLLRANIALEVIPTGFAPTTLVSHAIDRRDQDRRDARGGGDPDDIYDSVWVVTDVDEFEADLRKARVTAEDHGIRFIVSNECFEIWLIWHCRELSRFEGRAELHSIATDLGLIKGKHPQLELLRGRFEQAERRAVQARSRHAANGTEFPHDNPSPAVDLLIRRLIDDSAASTPDFRHEL